MAAAALTAEQLEAFHAFGFVHLPGHLPPALTRLIQDETDAVSSSVVSHSACAPALALLSAVLTIRRPLPLSAEQALAAQFRGTPLGSQWMWTRASAVPEAVAPTLHSLQEHPLLHGVAAQLRGDDLIGQGVDAQRYIGETAWHSDGHSEDGGWTAKFMLYLDDVDESTGCLHVFPGSHLFRGEEHAAFQAFISAAPFGAVPGRAVPTRPGDVIVFNTNVFHGSTGGGINRRVINIDYQLNPTTREGEHALIDSCEKTAKGRDHPVVRTFPFNYSKEWLGNRSGNPVRQHWIDRWRELGCLDGLQVAEGGPMPEQLQENGRIAALNEAHSRAAAANADARL
jgi:hypothetical protein